MGFKEIPIIYTLQKKEHNKLNEHNKHR